MTHANSSAAAPVGPLKRAAAEAALDLVTSGMLIGLGSGSTAMHVTLGLGARLADGRLERVRGVPSSEATRDLAERSGIPLVELPAEGVDLAIDGMDEVDPQLGAIKGLGGAMLREKIVASSADRFVLVGDASKRVMRLGQRTPVPVEVLSFGRAYTVQALRALELQPKVRTSGGTPVRTDNGNVIVDCAFDPERDVQVLARALDGVPGLLGHGLFLGMASAAFIASADGVERMTRPGRT